MPIAKSNEALPTNVPLSAFKATLPLALNSTLEVRLPREVPFNAATAALRSRPVLVNVLQSSFAGFGKAGFPSLALFTNRSTSHAPNSSTLSKPTRRPSKSSNATPR